MSRKNVIFNLQEQIDALSANKDYTKIVVGGSKGLLKIFDLTDNDIRPLTDLRAARARRFNLLYSTSHVAWSFVNENVIATTSTSGAVVLWDVEKVVLNQTYKAHSRSATKVCFHKQDQFILISGSKDASVLQYDLRVQDPVKRFSSGSMDPIRDIQFGIHGDHTDIFVVADDGGSVRLWDLRKPDRPLRYFVAHHGPASISLNPSYDDRNIVATAGRDKYIRIWKWLELRETESDDPIYSVEATASVARVQWRPFHKYQVASCSVVNDTNIYIWDIRRPFIPFATFDEHKDLCTDLIWKQDESDSLISVGKDGLLILHFFENAHRPLNHVNDVALDISPTGDLAIALSSQLKQKNEALKEAARIKKGETVARKRRTYDPFQSLVRSHLISCQPFDSSSLSSQNFINLAKRYKFCGVDVRSSCDYNGCVAEELGEHQLAHTWRLIGLLSSYSSLFNENLNINETSGITDLKPCVGDGLTCSEDLFFGDAELNLDGLVHQKINRIFSEICCDSVETETFMKRRNIQPYVDTTLNESFEEWLNLKTAEDANSDQENGKFLFELGEMKVRTDLTSIPSWDPTETLKSIIENYSEMGDVQSCVCILLVLGEKTSKIIDSSVQKLWFLDYIDMLRRFELWSVSAEVIKLCWIPSISCISNESTFISIICPVCSAPSLTASSECKKCNSSFKFPCVVCCQPVAGIWAWCRGCKHGGHPDHLEKWFSMDIHCASGCGHICIDSITF